MKKELWIMSILICLIMLSVYAMSLIQIENADITESTRGIKVGGEYKTNLDIYLGKKSDAENDEYTDGILKGTDVKVKKIRDNMAFVEHDQSKGWMPDIYLSDESKRIIAIDRYMILTGESTSMYIAPSEEYKIGNFKEGRLLATLSEYKDDKGDGWYQVASSESEKIETPIFVKVSEIESFEEKNIREGHIKNKIIYEDESLKNESANYEEVVYLEDTIDGICKISYIEEGKEKIGYVKKSNFDSIIALDKKIGWNVNTYKE